MDLTSSPLASGWRGRVSRGLERSPSFSIELPTVIDMLRIGTRLLYLLVTVLALLEGQTYSIGAASFAVMVSVPSVVY